LERAASGQLAAEPELVELAARQLEADRALVAELTRAQELVTQAREAGDLAGVQRVVGQVNALLRELWDSTGEGSSGRRRAASVWGARFPLNSAGSFQLLRLQVSPELTWQGNTYTVLAPLEIQAQIGGDYDGDRFIHMLREVLPEETYEAARAGAGQLATDAAMIKMQDYVQGSAELLYDALAAEPGSALHRVGTEAVADLKARLHEVLDQSPIPARDVTALVDSVVGKIAARDPKGAWAELFSTLPTRFAVQMRELAATLGGSPWLILNRALEDGLSALGTAVSLTDLNRVTQTGAVDLPAVSRAMPEYTLKPQPASSEMLTGAILTSSSDQFRLQTILKYNAYREPTRYTAEERELAAAAMSERFAALNDGIVRSGDEAAFEGTLAQERSLDWLTELAREYHADFGTRTVNEALVL